MVRGENKQNNKNAEYIENNEERGENNELGRRCCSKKKLGSLYVTIGRHKGKKRQENEKKKFDRLNAVPMLSMEKLSLNFNRVLEGQNQLPCAHFSPPNQGYQKSRSLGTITSKARKLAEVVSMSSGSCTAPRLLQRPHSSISSGWELQSQNQNHHVFFIPISSLFCELNESKSQWQDEPEQSHTCKEETALHNNMQLEVLKMNWESTSISNSCLLFSTMSQGVSGWNPYEQLRREISQQRENDLSGHSNGWWNPQRRMELTLSVPVRLSMSCMVLHLDNVLYLFWRNAQRAGLEVLKASVKRQNSVSRWSSMADCTDDEHRPLKPLHAAKQLKVCKSSRRYDATACRMPARKFVMLTLPPHPDPFHLSLSLFSAECFAHSLVWEITHLLSLFFFMSVEATGHGRSNPPAYSVCVMNRGVPTTVCMAQNAPPTS
ncbi:hypothetical protein DNTS_008001 [Danionella cerebrum]|uniref:Uncharacterized protein n=1 Tax=Danionella cerebrum TaxID=2873325 RepID=A0A553NMJ8_9TELE|nr:hypothetical protein DNTS_008001 [Danionella translucida]